jgi:ubiquinone/menaquinone biosynthesis C-methylase UbiE
MEIRWMRDVEALTSGRDILEVGCGRGAGAGMILDAFQPARFHASDLDIEMIRRARDYLSPDRRKRIAFHVTDAFRLPYRDGAFDAIFGFGVLHHVPDWQGALSEIVRVLREGGVYFIEELYPALYQNVITRHILLHPREGRFRSPDLKQAFRAADLSFMRALESRKLGILGVAVKDQAG